MTLFWQMGWIPWQMSNNKWISPSTNILMIIPCNYPNLSQDLHHEISTLRERGERAQVDLWWKWIRKSKGEKSNPSNLNIVTLRGVWNPGRKGKKAHPRFPILTVILNGTPPVSLSQSACHHVICVLFHWHSNPSIPMSHTTWNLSGVQMRTAHTSNYPRIQRQGPCLDAE